MDLLDGDDDEPLLEPVWELNDDLRIPAARFGAAEFK